MVRPRWVVSLMALLEMKEYKVSISISPVPSVTHERLGMPILLRVGGASQFSSPTPQDSFHSVDGTALLGLYTEPEKAGFNYWLVTSWFWHSNNLLVPNHAYPLVSEKDGWQCRWMKRPVRIKSVWDGKRHKMIEVYINKHTMTELFDPYGGPLGEAKWLAGRLLPRRVPAALRLDNDHLQLWMKL